MTSTNFGVLARLILTHLKLDDLLDVELRRLRQQELKFQQGLSLSGSSPAIVGSHTASSQPTSTPVSCSISANSSQPFELPDVDISDLLSTTVQSPNTSSRQLSCTDRGNRKKANNRKKVDENCRQNNLRNVDHSSTANSNKLSVTNTLSAGDSRKRQSSRHSTLALDSDDEFEDLHCSNVAKKQLKEAQHDESKADYRSAAAEKVIHKTGVESCSKQDVTSVITNSPASCSLDVCSSVSNSSASTPVTLHSGSVQRTVAQRLSKFAFKDTLFWRKQDSSTSSRVTCITTQASPVNEHSAYLSIGSYHL